MTAVDADEKVTESLLSDLDFEPPCSLPAQSCAQTAVWYLRMTCCGVLVAALCERHKTILGKEFLLSDAIFFTWQCAVCSTRGRATAITEFIPIKAGS